MLEKKTNLLQHYVTRFHKDQQNSEYMSKVEMIRL